MPRISPTTGRMSLSFVANTIAGTCRRHSRTAQRSQFQAVLLRFGKWQSDGFGFVENKCLAEHGHSCAHWRQFFECIDYGSSWWPIRLDGTLQRRRDLRSQRFQQHRVNHHARKQHHYVDLVRTAHHAPYGSPLQLLAKVQGISGGQCQRHNRCQDGSTTIGTYSLAPDGSAFILLGRDGSYSFPVGAHSLTAKYGGDQSFNAQQFVGGSHSR